MRWTGRVAQWCGRGAREPRGRRAETAQPGRILRSVGHEEVLALVEHPEPPVAPELDLDPAPGIAAALGQRRELEHQPADAHGVVVGHHASVAEAETASASSPSARARHAAPWAPGATAKRVLWRGRYSASTRLAPARSTTPARRSSVTSRSWWVPKPRSTRPLACGLRAAMERMPSSSSARPTCVRRRVSGYAARAEAACPRAARRCPDRGRRPRAGPAR